MTNNQLTREKVEWLHEAAEECAAVGIKLTMKPDEILMFTSSLLGAMDSEPVTEVLSNRSGNDTSTIDRALPVGTQLYRHAQPAPVVPDELLKEYLRLVQCMLSDYRDGNHGDARRWIRHIAKASDAFEEKHGLSPFEMARKTCRDQAPRAQHPANCMCVDCINSRPKWKYV
ncbi:hypothetical protein [Klebsiella pneumoniae]|uniref:hypothetical protein n=1 Tax=Klebsiella pneumoniae TaxID=573 RepID=UPI001B8AEEB1|nr:hypothetical protein [Klebsiella pneumoniae]MBR7307434.1 hypothetical protein [Klebsiella pneumoniae]MBR7345030.1 hypothetical protein [Klebsiella pneumoniae]